MAGQEQEQVSSICSECGAPVRFALGALQVKCSHCDAGLAVEHGTRLVRLACPRCAGNFYYIDGSLSGTCPYCDASLLGIGHDRVLRYLVRPRAERPEGAEGAELTLMPFWHLGGLVYSWNVGSKVEIVDDAPVPASTGEQQGGQDVHQTIRRDSGPMKVFQGRVLDVTLPDSATQAVGIASLRLRGSLFPIEPFVQEHEQLARVVPPRLDHGRARGQLMSRALSLTAPGGGMTRMDLRRVDMVAERLSLLYYPFWVLSGEHGHVVWDGVSGEPEHLAAEVEPGPRAESTIMDSLEVIELTCRSCGETLKAGNHPVVLPCAACGAFWQVTGQGLEPFEARYARPQTGYERLAWLPFWRVPVKVGYSGNLATRVADLTGVLGVLRPPSQLTKSPPESALCYYAPAYGAMKLPRIDHAARDMTRHQPVLAAADPVGEGERFNCFFGSGDAVQLAYVTWMQVLTAVVVPKLRSLRIETGAPSLWYVPFDDRGRELVNLLTGLRYDWAAFRGVRH